MAKDLVVIGAGLGGLSAAIHARHAGWNVLVLHKGPIGGKAAKIDTDGYRLDPGPSIIILPEIYEAIFRSVGRNLTDYLNLRRLNPISRVILGSQEPIDLPSSRAETEALVDMVNPQDGLAFRKLMGKLDDGYRCILDTIFAHPIDRWYQLADPKLIRFASLFDVRLTYKQQIDTWFTSPLLRSFFYGFPSYGGQTYDAKAPGAFLIPYLMLQQGVFYPEGGVSSIPGAFERLAREMGVEFQEAEVTQLSAQNRQVSSLKTTQSGTIEGDAFISNVDRYTTDRWLGIQHDEPPSMSYFTVHWGFTNEYPAISHHTLVVPDDFVAGFESLYRADSYAKNPIVYLNNTSATDPSAAPSGCTNLFAVVTSPSVSGTVNWQDKQADFAQAIRSRLSDLGLVPSSETPVFERIQSPLLFAERDGNYRGSLYGPIEKHRLFGMLPLPNVSSSLRNLFFAGGSVQPGAGLPMVALSGKFAAGKLGHPS